MMLFLLLFFVKFDIKILFVLKQLIRPIGNAVFSLTARDL